MKNIYFKNGGIKSSNGSIISFFFLLLFCFTSYAQVGINTTNPKGTLDIITTNNTGLVLPRVTAIEAVTDGYGNLPVNGTTVYDISRNTTCFYQNDTWICIGVDGSGNPVLTDETPLSFNTSSTIDYIKASNTDLNGGDFFGLTVSLSEDGNTLAVGSVYENSNATGINGNQFDNSSQLSGAVFVFIRTGTIWSQQAYIKASNAEFWDRFGFAISLSNNGNTLAVSAEWEDSNATGIDGNQLDNSSPDSGAVYVFNRSGTVWAQQTYIKASNTENGDMFGQFVVLSGDGNTLAISASNEDSNTTGINGSQMDNSSPDSGAVYVFIKTGNIWTQQAFIKASNAESNDLFGRNIALSIDGNTLVISAELEDSSATGINGNQLDNSLLNSGAVYVFNRVGITWLQEAYIKTSNPNVGDAFGSAFNSFNIAHGQSGKSMAISNDGNTLVVGVGKESSNATGINGNQFDNSAFGSGAVYVFVRSGSTWTQQAYIKSSNTETGDYFGASTALSGDGNTLVVSAPSEDSDATGINGNQADNSIVTSGAVYIFKRIGITWTQQTYVKASNTSTDPWNTLLSDGFGYAIAISGDGNTLAVGSPMEDSEATGINGNQNNDLAQDAGAVYVYKAN
jgi:hypothetical protein